MQEIERERENDELLYAPTPAIKEQKEKERLEEGISEYIMLKSIPPMLRRNVFNTNIVKYLNANTILREYYSIGRGIEYSFGEFSFWEVVVGFRYRKRLPNKKKQQWSKKPHYFTGFVGPLVRNPTVDGGSSNAYVVRFLDGDVRRFACNELEKFLVNTPIGEFAFLNANLNVV